MMSTRFRFFGKFSVFVNDVIDQKDEILLQKCISFINEMSESSDIDLLPSLGEFSFQLKSLSVRKYQEFIKLLSITAASKLELENELWEKGNDIHA